jgi:hypothetical protein
MFLQTLTATHQNKPNMPHWLSHQLAVTEPFAVPEEYKNPLLKYTQQRIFYADKFLISISDTQTN